MAKKRQQYQILLEKRAKIKNIYPIWFRLGQDRLHAWCAHLLLQFCINCKKSQILSKMAKKVVEMTKKRQQYQILLEKRAKIKNTYPIWFPLGQDRLHAWCAHLPLRFCINCTKIRRLLFWAKMSCRGRETLLLHLVLRH